ncbi:putative transcription regulator [Pseudoalteromonas citrea]|uniref:Cys-tRNA(Pro)/Cys-tRNA(Cys) deacylase n=2 Tax=Pseudoalteromonas citrea TaxID=43655 RepID=A0AAD4FPZ1_9GAMM|nr:aminoacyl-tRNA deacylase [Pseudoalteromonas citrea]KAF7764536.1 putative transcription regulator [Pseudoalteromonas citrea]
MTPAIKLLEKHHVPFEVLQFRPIETSVNFANDAAEQLCLNPEAVFKTIVINVDGVLHVAILPSTNKVDLKAYAKACKGKRAELADAQLAQSSTGYVIGGISPFAQKKRLKTLLHHSAKHHMHVYVSAGRRGLEVRVSPHDIVRMCGADFAIF